MHSDTAPENASTPVAFFFAARVSDGRSNAFGVLPDALACGSGAVKRALFLPSGCPMPLSSAIDCPASLFIQSG